MHHGVGVAAELKGGPRVVQMTRLERYPQAETFLRVAPGGRDFVPSGMQAACDVPAHKACGTGN